MKITYLGSAAAEGIPAVFCKCRVCDKSRKDGGRNIRTRSQAMINDDLLVDYPPDSNAHFLKNNIAMSDIHNLLITHSHPDHLYFEEFIYYGTWYTNDEAPELNIYGNSKVISTIRTYLMNDPCWGEGKLEQRVLLHVVKAFETIQVGKYMVTPLPAKHKPDEECFIYMIEQGKERLLYGHDTGYFKEETLKYINGKHFDLVSLDCTIGERSESTGHMGIPNVRELTEKLKECGCIDNTTKVIINHFSHNGNLTYDELVEAVKDDGYIVSYDGACVDVSL